MRRPRIPVALLLGAALAVPLAAWTAVPAVSQDAMSDGASPTGVGMMAATPLPARVTIGYDAVAPRTLDIVTGESVKWTNDSVRVHTVTADDSSFDSGLISTSDTFTHRFVTAGVVPYHCVLHPAIQGVVVVHDILLDPPGQAATPNHPFPISGRAALPAGTPVSIEADSGAGFAPVASASVGDGGAFAASVDPATTTSYRAVAGAVTSDPVRLLVLDRRITLSLRRTDRRIHLSASVTPASRGGRIVLQLYLRERFGWWPVRIAKLGSKSGASFTLDTRRSLRARVRYTLPDGATPLATSATIRLNPLHRHRHRAPRGA